MERGWGGEEEEDGAAGGGGEDDEVGDEEEVGEDVDRIVDLGFGVVVGCGVVECDVVEGELGFSLPSSPSSSFGSSVSIGQELEEVFEAVDVRVLLGDVRLAVRESVGLTVFFAGTTLVSKLIRSESTAA